MKLEVFVGNIGLVYSGVNKQEAARTFQEYKRQSRDHVGRAAGEPVTLIGDGEPIQEYNPRRDS